MKMIPVVVGWQPDPSHRLSDPIVTLGTSDASVYTVERVCLDCRGVLREQRTLRSTTVLCREAAEDLAHPCPHTTTYRSMYEVWPRRPREQK